MQVAEERNENSLRLILELLPVFPRRTTRVLIFAFALIAYNQWILNKLVRVAIISILPSETVTNAELEAELRQRLDSKSFSVDHIAILDDDTTVGPTPAILHR
jgi:hypothetical protein